MKNILRFVCVVALVLSASTNIAAQSNTATAESIAAEKLLAQAYPLVGKDNTKALELINKAIAIDPNNAKGYGYRGVVYEYQKNYDQAIAEYSKAIEIDPAMASTYRSRGSAYLAKGNYDAAFIDLNKAIEIDPNNGLAYALRGVSHYRKNKDYDRAIADITQGARLEPNNKYISNLRIDLQEQILLGILLGKKWTCTTETDTVIYEFPVGGKSYTCTVIAKDGKQTKTNYIIVEIEAGNDRNGMRVNNSNYKVVWARDPKKTPDDMLIDGYHERFRGKVNVIFGLTIIDEHTIQLNTIIDEYTTQLKSDIPGAFTPLYDIEPAEVQRLAEIKAKEKAEAEALAQAKAEAAKEQEAARAKALAETKAANALRKEQLLKVIKTSGSYVRVGNGNGWRAIRFDDIFNDGMIEAWVVTSYVSRNGPRETSANPFPCAVVDGQVKINDTTFSVSNNGNLLTVNISGVTNTWRFEPHISVQGKAFSRVNGSGDRGYGFRGSQLLIQNQSGALIDDKAYSYKYENGKITTMYNDIPYSLLTVIGPYIRNGYGDIWQLD